MQEGMPEIGKEEKIQGYSKINLWGRGDANWYCRGGGGMSERGREDKI